MSRYRQRFLAIADRYSAGIIGLTIIVLAANLYYYPEHNNQLNFLQKMLFCATFIYLLWKYDRFIPGFLASLAEMSFGIFFLHYYTLLVLKAVYEKFAGHAIPGNLINWIIFLAAVLIITVLIIRLVKLIFPKISRQLIGC
jgi:probable poly-beta-1,6-N-acetyl-D-glucosamine export protein